MYPKKKIRLILCIFFAIFLTSCSKNIEDKTYFVKKVINGNTVLLNNGIIFELSGIYDTDESLYFLKKYLLHTKVKIKLDKGYKNEKRNFKNGYLITLDNIPINSFMIRYGVSKLNTYNIGDSLEVYYAYQKGFIRENRTNYDNNTNNSIASIVSKVEKSVFVIHVTDKNENPIGYGTGFFINSDGTAISNYHVFDKGEKFFIKTIEGNIYNVEKILKYNQTLDYIIFKVEGDNFPPLSISYKTPAKGEDILVIGNPLKLESTVTKGIVSAIRSYYINEDYLQIDAAIDHGSSGSPVINLNGEVVGIATSGLNANPNYNFALNIKVIFSE